MDQLPLVEDNEDKVKNETRPYTAVIDQPGSAVKFCQIRDISATPIKSKFENQDNVFEKTPVSRSQQDPSRLKTRPSINSLPSIAHLQRYFTSPGEKAVRSKYIYPLPERTLPPNNAFTIQDLGIPSSPLRQETKFEKRQQPDLVLLRSHLENTLSHVLQKWNDNSEVQILLEVTNDAITSTAKYITWLTGKEDKHHLRRIRELKIDVLSILQSLQDPNRHRKILTQTEIIKVWVEEIKKLLHEQDARNKKQHESYAFLFNSTQDSDDIVRYCTFLTLFDPSSIKLASPSSSEFLTLFRSGQKLCDIFNNFVSQSARQHGHIDRYHTDTQRPYRAIENLQFFAKAVEIRFERRFREWNVKEIIRATDRGNKMLLEGINTFCEAAINTLATESESLPRKDSLHW